MTAEEYPRPGTMADKILQHIRDNPGVSVNAIWTQLSLNPSPTRHCLKMLLSRGLIEDTPNEQGHHSYTEKPSDA